PITFGRGSRHLDGRAAGVARVGLGLHFNAVFADRQFQGPFFFAPGGLLSFGRGRDVARGADGTAVDDELHGGDGLVACRFGDSADRELRFRLFDVRGGGLCDTDLWR